MANVDDVHNSQSVRVDERISFGEFRRFAAVTLPASKRIVLGRYELFDVIGRGGAATVYRALDHTRHDHVAVKEIPVGHEMARRAGAEVRAACLLDHPGVVRLLDFGEDTHAAYLVSELVEGDTLATRYRSGDMDDGDVISALADVFGGLAHAHERGVTHRDIKPGNILVDHDGRAKLTDFGIARIVGDQGLTQTGALVGTMSYMAPEHAVGGRTGPFSDVYSACLVLREGLTGVNPIASGNQLETLRRAGAADIPALATERPDLPRRLTTIIDAGLARDGAARPSAGQLAEALERSAAGATPRAFAAPKTPATRAAGQAHALRPPGRILCAAIAAATATILLRRFSTLDPPMVAAAAAGVGAAFALVPWITTLVAWTCAMALLATHAPAAAGLIGAAGLVMLVPFRRRGHLLAIPMLAPVVGALGITPVIAGMSGLVTGVARRLWVALSAAAAVLVWQLVEGADPAIDGGRLNGVWPDVRSVRNPVDVVDTVGSVVRARPSIVTVGAVLVVGAMVVPVIARLRGRVGRSVGVLIWIAAMVAAIVSTGGSLEHALGAMIPGGIILVVGAVFPWQRLQLRARPPEAVTLRANMEREPTA